MAEVPDLSSTTLVCIDTDNHLLARTALLISAESCGFARVLSCSDLDWNLPGCDHLPIARIGGTADYNRLLLKDLAGHIDTDHLLIVQFDGFIANPQCWDPGFCDYDYVGAPWPHHRGDRDVGNGGFSLRSRRLLRALQDPAVTVGAEGEDVTICRRYREHLERGHGIRFPDYSVALRFSHEGDAPPPEGSFGFHGMINTARFYERLDPDFFIDHLSPYKLRDARILLLVAWYNARGLAREAHRLLDRVCAVQSPADVAANGAKAGLSAADRMQIARMMGIA